MSASSETLREAPPVELTELLTTAGLRLEGSGRRADVVLAAPERRNAMSPTLWRALAAAGTWLRDHADVVVLRAEGPSFCAGLDRRAFTPAGIPGEVSLFALAALPSADADAAIAEYQEGFRVWSDGPFVSVAAVQGHAVGGGFQLALACDLRIAADDARFAMREPALGIVPDLGGTGTLLDAVGYARALEICATARWVSAEEAGRIGLVQGVVPVDGLSGATDTLVSAILANPAGAVLGTRELLRGAAGRTPVERRAAERAVQIGRLHALAAEAGAQGRAR
jgi:enoyl-CoA hydratase/carnithine racemase